MDAREQQIATKYLKTFHGIEKPDAKSKTHGVGKLGEALKGKNPAEEIPVLTQEAYDLFAEKGDNLNYIFTVQRKREQQKETGKKEETSPSSKEDLIKQGKIATVLAGMDEKAVEGEISASSMARVKEIDDRLSAVFATPGVYDSFVSDLSRQIRLRHQATEAAQLSNFDQRANILIARINRAAKVENRSLTSSEQRYIDQYAQIQRTAAERKAQILSDTEVFDLYRLKELKRYRSELSGSNHFAVTPTRRKYLHRVEQNWAEGKKIIGTGETGTGKTELIKYASVSLFGVKPESVTGHQDMSIYELLGKSGFKVQEGDIFRPAPMIRAMTGRNGKGQPFLFDEIDRAPNQAVMGIKTILNARPGDKDVKVQTDSEGSFDVGPDYAVAATANIKSEKYATATELDPAIVRVFDAPMDIDYMPASEVYDLAIATLLDIRGNLPLGDFDARVVLKSLCDAASHIQAAYQGKKVMIGAGENDFIKPRGQESTDKVATLKKALLDPGRTLGFLDGWMAARAKGVVFEEYLSTRIIDFINNRAYPDEDRYHLTRIFALKGFLKGHTTSELLVTGLDQATLDTWCGGSVTMASTAKTGETLPADKVAKLDPYRALKRPVTAEGKALLEETVVSEDELIKVITTMRDSIDWSRDNVWQFEQYLNAIKDSVVPKFRSFGGFRQVMEIYFDALTRFHKVYPDEKSYDYSDHFRDKLVPILGNIVEGAFARVQIRTAEDVESLDVFKPLKQNNVQFMKQYFTTILRLGDSSTDPQIVDKIIGIVSQYKQSGALAKGGVYSGGLGLNWDNILVNLNKKRLQMVQ